MNHKLKIGILIDSTRLEYHQVEILKEIQKSDSLEIVKFITRDNVSTLKSSNHIFYKLFNTIDKKLFGRGAKYLSKVSIEDIITNTTSKEKPDIIVNLSTSHKHYKNDTLYGTWQYVYNSNPHGYWEVVNKNPFTQVTLQKSGAGFENGLVLAKYSTRTDQKSMRKNRETIAWQSHLMIIRELKKLARDKEEYFKDKKSILNFNHDKSDDKKEFIDPRFKFSDKQNKTIPTNLQMIPIIFKMLKTYTTFTVRKFFPMDRWFILYSETKDEEINPNLSEYKRFYAPSKNYFIADPFVVDEGDKSYLFYEELNYDNYRGYLKVAEYENGEFKEPKTVLEQEYHLSYPNVFKIKNTYYMVPESFENKTIDLFEAVEFPTKWKKKKTLISDIEAVDSTFLYHNNKWWMFVSVIAKEGFSTDEELSIFYSDDILHGEWTPHKNNPVVCDVTSSRPAGNIIEKDGKLYRPAQDCSGIYGRKIVINEIDILNEDTFKEHIVSKIDSSFADDLSGVHTLNSSKKLTVIDAIKSR